MKESIQSCFGAGIAVCGWISIVRTVPDGSPRLILRWRRARVRCKVQILYFPINVMKCYEMLWKHAKCYEMLWNCVMKLIIEVERRKLRLPKISKICYSFCTLGLVGFYPTPARFRFLSFWVGEIHQFGPKKRPVCIFPFSLPRMYL